ncbi:MAG: kelch motif-containing protein, partial [Actinomycetota bacterium]|nr:kelch motif-containing protein [Actinomycetota bacterium]
MPRFDHTTTLLSTADVLVAGGRLVAPEPLTNLASAEVWDPQTDRWRPTGSMNQPRWQHTATLPRVVQV